ncbi:GNAT family N-acetyltransferase [Nakamurella endophytica]|uniref:GNAT family N-acetyltransferase n=1 Tax=Nakamurella endophytica TaxID=1748367 RepID=UPI00166DA758|nr:GNAT family N-acetyltransferase [Nakamurella endophytica]
MTAATWPALVDLFGPAGASNGCWCQYWLLGPGYHRRPRVQNRDDLQRSVLSGPPPGLLAVDGAGTALAWCRVGPRSELGWLDRRPASAPVDDRPVWSVSCFYVRRDARRQGWTSVLVDAAVEHARRHDAPAVEACPVDTAIPGATRNLFPGVASVFLRAGFTEVARRVPDRPVLRRELQR